MKIELVKGIITPYRPWHWYDMSDTYVNKEFPYRWIMNLDLKVNGKRHKLYKDTKNVEIEIEPFGSTFADAVNKRERARLDKFQAENPEYFTPPYTKEIAS